MGMVNMKLTTKEVKKEGNEMAVCGQDSPYPWGMCIRLEKEELDKLKMAKLPQVGDELHITAVGKVTSVASSLRDQNDEDKTVSIQIVMMSVDDEGADDNDGVKAENKENGKKTAPKPKPKSGGTVMSHYGSSGDGL